MNFIKDIHRRSDPTNHFVELQRFTKKITKAVTYAEQPKIKKDARLEKVFFYRNSRKLAND